MLHFIYLFFQWVVMKYCDGGEFFDVLISGRVAISERSMRPLFLQLLRAVVHMHKHRVCHLDIRYLDTIF